MKKLFVLLITVFTLSSVGYAQEKETTTLLFVRHAEKMVDGTKNPSLTLAGEARAKRIANWIQKEYGQLSAIYSTNYKRTLETAQFSSNLFNVPITKYGLKDPQGLVSGIIESYTGNTVLIVGHSNTTPTLVNFAIDEEKYSALDESDYSKLFIVRISEDGEAEVSIHSTDVEDN